MPEKTGTNRNMEGAVKSAGTGCGGGRYKDGIRVD